MTHKTNGRLLGCTLSKDPRRSPTYHQHSWLSLPLLSSRLVLLGFYFSFPPVWNVTILWMFFYLQTRDVLKTFSLEGACIYFTKQMSATIPPGGLWHGLLLITYTLYTCRHGMGMEMWLLVLLWCSVQGITIIRDRAMTCDKRTTDWPTFPIGGAHSFIVL